MNKRGFTLIELIVVIAIIAVLAAIIAPNAFKAVEKAKISSTIEDCRSIKTGAMSLYSDTGVWSIDNCEEAFSANDNCGGTAFSGWDGPYLEKWPPSARWGGVYAYRRGTDLAAAVGGYNWDNAATNPDVRVISITGVPLSAAQKIETQVDGTATPGATDSTDSWRYGGAPLVCYFLISYD